MKKAGRNKIDEIEKMTDEVHDAFFKEFSKEEIETYYKLSIKVMKGIENLDHYFMMKKK